MLLRNHETHKLHIVLLISPLFVYFKVSDSFCYLLYLLLLLKHPIGQQTLINIAHLIHKQWLCRYSFLASLARHMVSTCAVGANIQSDFLACHEPSLYPTTSRNRYTILIGKSASVRTRRQKTPYCLPP